VLQTPVLTALVLSSAYYGIVAVVQGVRSRRAHYALVGAALFWGLATAATAWVLGGI
jgi:hypothetical protein